INVDAVARDSLAARTRLGLDHVGGFKPGGAGSLRELAAELAKGQVLAALLDETKRRSIPERGRTAVAQNNLVALGDVEQLSQAILHPLHQVLHRRLAVRCAEKLRPITC